MKKWILLFMLCLVCAFETANAAGLYSLALVTKDQVNIRKKPGGQMVDRLRKGEYVNIIGVENVGGKEWDRIIVSRKTDNQVICGYVDATFLQDVSDKFSGIVEAAPGDRHMLLRNAEGRVAAAGETFMGNLSVSHWPQVRQAVISRFTSAGVDASGRLYTSTEESRPGYLLDRTDIDRIFPCAEDLELLVFRLKDGRIFCGSDRYAYLFPERYRNAEQVVFNEQFSAALQAGIVRVTTENIELEDFLCFAEGLGHILKITCGERVLACLDDTGKVHIFSDDPELLEADELEGVTDIAAASSFLVTLSDQGDLRMFGRMPVRNRNYTVISEDIRMNFSDLLADWQDVVEIRASWRMLLGRQRDGHIRVLFANRYE
ncbi:MAG: hypothetical protein IJ088_10150 [Clostridia bacterium]|nr:hypothetical protein [Clostridia bacterium]